MILRELITVLGFDLDSAGVKTATDAFASLTAKALVLKGAWDASVGAVSNWVDEARRAGTEARVVASRLGTTASELMELEAAARLTGAHTEDLADLLKELQIRAHDALTGSKDMATAFRLAGVAMTDSRGKVRPAIDLFNDLADGIARIQDDGKRTFIADTLGSDAGTRLLPLLKQGTAGIEALRTQARALGYTMEDETAAGAERLTLALEGVRMVGLGLTRRFAAALFPVLEKWSKRIVDLVLEHRELIDRGIKRLAGFVEGLIDTLGRLGEVLVRFRRFFALFAGATGAMAAVKAVQALTKALWGLNRAQVMAVAIPAAAFVGWLLLAAAIAAVIDDIQTYFEGGDSLLGRLFKEWLEEPAGANEHWLTMTVRDLVQLLKDAIDKSRELYGLWRTVSQDGAGIDESTPGRQRQIESAARGRARLIGQRVPRSAVPFQFQMPALPEAIARPTAAGGGGTAGATIHQTNHIAVTAPDAPAAGREVMRALERQDQSARRAAAREMQTDQER